MYRRDDHTVDAQKVHRVAHTGHVCDRVQRTNFVIVHVAHWAAVRLGLGLCNGIINRTCVLLDCVRQVQTVDDFRDMTGRCMVVMVAVFMLVMVLMLVIIVMMVVLVVMVIMVMVVVVVMIPMMMVMMVLVVVIIMVVVMVFLFVFMFMIIMMMIMVVVVLMRVRLVFLFPMYGHTHVRTRDAAGLSRFGCHLHTVQAQFLHFLQKCRLIIQ